MEILASGNNKDILVMVGFNYNLYTQSMSVIVVRLADKQDLVSIATYLSSYNT